MKRLGVWFFAFTLIAALFLLAVTGTLAAGTWTIHGKVVYPDGRPGAGLHVILLAHTPEDGIDKYNAIWQIPNYDRHPVVTDSAGEFTMTGVQDYPQNTTHRYVLYVDEPDMYINGSFNFRLSPETPNMQVTIKMNEAAIIRLHLKDRDGKPFNGTRAVYVQSGRQLGDASKGISYIAQVKFVDGVGKWRLTIKDKKDFYARVAILPYPDAVSAIKDMKQRGLRVGDATDALRHVVRSATGRPVEKEIKLLSQVETPVELSL